MGGLIDLFRPLCQCESPHGVATMLFCGCLLTLVFIPVLDQTLIDNIFRCGAVVDDWCDLFGRPLTSQRWPERWGQRSNVSMYPLPSWSEESFELETLIGDIITLNGKRMNTERFEKCSKKGKCENDRTHTLLFIKKLGGHVAAPGLSDQMPFNCWGDATLWI